MGFRAAFGPQGSLASSKAWMLSFEEADSVK